jgi:signal recognition particle receptor subunit alpha
VYQRILQLAYIPDLLARVKALFLDLFTPFLRALLAHSRNSTSALSSSLRRSFAEGLKAWEETFTRTLRELERGSAAAARRNAPLLERADSTQTAEGGEDTDGAATGTDTPEKNARGDGAEIAKNVEALKARLKAAELGGGRGGKGPAGRRQVSRKVSARAGGTETPGTPGSGTESVSNTPSKKSKAPAKEMRRWEGGKVSEKHVEALDFSSKTQDGGAKDEEKGTLEGWIDEKSMGKKGEDGAYEVADVLPDGDSDDEEDEAEEGKGGFLSRFAPALGSSNNASGGFFSRMTGSHALTEADVAPALSAMQAHLQSKNVAADVAQRLCASVSRSLVGRQLGSFGSVKTEVRKALEEAITRILTPKSSTDILVEIAQKRQRGLAARAGAVGSKGSEEALEPYSMAFVGVNGVGKSTSLAKVCFWLLQNRLRVLIAACDTFRSGAVEQLRVHVRNLGQLDVGGERVADGTADGKAKLELFERGYGKDAAGIAKEALAYAKKEHFDVVVIDSAGRQQGNEPLMRALAKLVSINKPDKVIFVGEAIVGNEAQAQVVGFNEALKNFSGVADPRGLDALLLTKWDAVADQVGTALTITSATGLPIALVGDGQTYTDLRRLRVPHIVDALMRS